jgi:hypothetical protein
LERLIDFIAYFEVLERDARTDDRLAVCRLSAIDTHHLLQSDFHDAAKRASPSCMYTGYCVILLVIDDDRDAVGCGYAQTIARKVGDERINTFEQILAFGLGHTDEMGIYFANESGMYLMGIDKILKRNAYFVGKYLAVGYYGFFLVSAKGVGIELAVSPLAETTFTHGGESPYTRVNVVFE